MNAVADLEAFVKAGDLAQVQRMLDVDPALSSRPTSMAVTALLVAVYYGHLDIAREIAGRRPVDLFEAAALSDVHRVEALLDEDAGAVNDFSADGFTPLGYAAYFNHPAIVRTLLDRGADPNLRSNNGLGVVPLHSALSGNHRQIADMLLDSGANIDVASAEGYTPLHYAALNGDIETAQRLLRRGAVPRANTEGRTPRDLALEKGATDLADLLG